MGMRVFVLIVFVLNLTLLLIHEMDAVRNYEWRMLPVLKTMQDNAAYRAFMLLHVPLYAFLLYLLLGGYQTAAYAILDGFLILHTLLHALFERHRQNRLTSLYSRTVIYAMGALSAVHVLLRGWW